MEITELFRFHKILHSKTVYIMIFKNTIKYLFINNWDKKKFNKGFLNQI